jgi:hypothetical protein
MTSRNKDKENWEVPEWRTTEEERKPLSKGITPKSFHSQDRRRPRPGNEATKQLHSGVQTNLLKEEKRKIGQSIDIKRSAFKAVTCLKTWPLQDRALWHLEQLNQVHQHEEHHEEDDEGCTTIDPLEISTGDSSTSSASSSGVSSVEETKRQLRNLSQSPAKSRLKVQFRQDFLAEQALTKPLSVAHKFGDALWSMEPRIFSTEKSKTGKRKYIVGHLGRIIDQYWRKVDRMHRHYYELIQENTPCRLYLDIEFNKASNPDIKDAIQEEFMTELFLELSNELDSVHALKVQRSDIVDLDSSTPTKFSRHWIVHLPGQSLFAHTLAAGDFMRDFISRLADEQGTGCLAQRRPLLHQHLFVSTENAKTTCFVDLGVYTRNRLFRILGSTKFGKPALAALHIAKANEYPFPEGFDNASFYVPVVSMDEVKEEEDLEEAVRKFVAATDWTDHAKALVDTLVVPVNVSKIEFPILPYQEKPKETKAQKSNKQGTAFQHQQRRGSSPFPMLDDFCVNVLGTRGGTQGSIRAWSINEGPDKSPISVTYQMQGNRWCECIGRAHKGNNIMWTIDLLTWDCVQSCHDPECRASRFRGKPIPVAKNVEECVTEELFEQALARIDLTPNEDKSTAAFDVDEDFERALASLQI